MYLRNINPLSRRFYRNILIGFMVLQSFQPVSCNSREKTEIFHNRTKSDRIDHETHYHKRTDKCETCHTNLKSHMLEHVNRNVKCNQCHFNTNEMQQSVDLIVKRPGLFSNVDETCRKCHPEETKNAKASLMNTMRGMINVNRFVFGEIDSPEHSHASLAPNRSPADSYFQQKCKNCHLSNDEPGPQITDNRADILKAIEQNRGGGCLACHLIKNETDNGSARLTNDVNDNHCAGCHSGSSRISLNYSGYMELFSHGETPEKNSEIVTLEDGRILKKIQEDLHHRRGMKCTDCHIKTGVMGDGEKHNHKDEAVKVRCTSCHLPAETYIHGSEHGRLSCDSCHTQDVPECIGCHIQYDTRSSQWVEYRGESEMKAPVLGVYKNKIRPFLPAMKLTIDFSSFRNSEKTERHVPVTKKAPNKIERHLFAPVFSHRITGKVRTCNSCHNDPHALGYGAGELKIKEDSIDFESSYETATGTVDEPKPLDAWIIPFKNYKKDMPLTTRSEGRPFTPEEQRKIIRVGYCLQCHEGSSPIFKNFRETEIYTHKRSK